MDFYSAMLFCEGFLISLWLGAIVTKNVVLYLRDKHGFKAPYNRSTTLLGYLERLAFTLSILSNMPVFIGVWLGAKFVGRWSPGRLHLEEEKDIKTASAAINIFLIGNLISLLFAVFGAYVIKGFKL